MLQQDTEVKDREYSGYSLTFYPSTTAPHRKCIVAGCTNHEDEGGFIGDLCSPCHHMLTTGNLDPTKGDTFIHRIARTRDNYKQFLDSLWTALDKLLLSHGFKQ